MAPLQHRRHERRELLARERIPISRVSSAGLGRVCVVRKNPVARSGDGVLYCIALACCKAEHTREGDQVQPAGSIIPATAIDVIGPPSNDVL